MKHLTAAALCLMFTSVAWSQTIFDYVRSPGGAYNWLQVHCKLTKDGSEVAQLEVTSQVWQGLRWKHRVGLYYPLKVRYPDTAWLLITGGFPGEKEDIALFSEVAKNLGAPVVVVGDIPNQPLFDNLSEDALIAYTFQKYLETGDPSWPALFPMTKAVLRCMDAASQYAEFKHHRPLRKFVVTGASKRAWTAWFVGVTDPRRVIGLVPMVYNNLNLPAQMKHQIETWGSYSPQLKDYADQGLLDLVNKPEGAKLAEIVDPYTYRDRATMPKLIINGANDPYWPTDAAKLYFPGLPEPKYMLTLPNTGHDVEKNAEMMKAQAAFFAACVGAGDLPQVTWQYSEGRHLRLHFGSQPLPESARLWTAFSPGGDFKDAKWESSELKLTGPRLLTWLRYHGPNYVAQFVDMTYKVGDRELPLTTTVGLIPGHLPKPEG